MTRIVTNCASSCGYSFEIITADVTYSGILHQTSSSLYQLRNPRAFGAAAVMDFLHRGGHVKVLTHDHHNSESFALVWRDVGRNLATTFEGVWSEHDATLFARIDIRSFAPADREQLFRYAYRAVARELHTLMEAACERTVRTARPGHE